MDSQSIIIIVLGLIICTLLFKKGKHESELVAFLQEREQSGSQDSTLLHASLQDTKQHLYALGKTISDISLSQKEISELKGEILGLSRLMSVPKLRGGLGETMLEDLLGNYLHSSRFQRQYRFSQGSIVDVAIFMPEGKILSIDSKFPMENFKRVIEGNETEVNLAKKELRKDLKKHINDIASKYILHNEDTLDFALMYIPSEHLYYDLISREEELYEYALSKSVIPASPSILFSYIHVLLLGFKSVDIEHRAEEILSHLKHTMHTLGQIDEELEKSDKHGRNMLKSMDRASSMTKEIGHTLGGLSTDTEIRKVQGATKQHEVSYPLS